MDVLAQVLTENQIRLVYKCTILYVKQGAGSGRPGKEWWLILCINLTEPWDIQVSGQTFFWVFLWGSLSLLGGSDGKEAACNVGDLDSIPGLGRSPGGGHVNPLQYSCLENPHGQRSLAGYTPWGCKQLDTTEQLSTMPYSEVVIQTGNE